VYHDRTKHIEIDCHFVREKVINQDILIKFISTNDQLANIFTKGLSSPRFLLLRSKLMVVSSPISLWGANRGSFSSVAQPLAPNSTQSPAQTPAHKIQFVECGMRQTSAYHAKSNTILDPWNPLPIRSQAPYQRLQAPTIHRRCCASQFV
jgi:hypothetical protein